MVRKETTGSMEEAKIARYKKEILSSDSFQSAMAHIRAIREGEKPQSLLHIAFLRARWFVKKYKQAEELAQEAVFTGDDTILYDTLAKIEFFENTLPTLRIKKFLKNKWEWLKIRFSKRN